MLYGKLLVNSGYIYLMKYYAAIKIITTHKDHLVILKMLTIQ